MARKAEKDRAKNNISTLNNLHIGSLSFNVIFILFNVLLKRRSLVAYLIFSIPCFIAEYVLESSSRPKYDATTKVLKSAGQDLAAPGLTEYMFDVIWITWACLVAVMLIGNWGWILWAVVPAYGAYKGYGLMGMARGMMGGAQQGQIPEEQAVQGNRRQRRAA